MKISKWLAALYRVNGEHLCFDDINDAYSFLNEEGCSGSLCVAVVNHAHARAAELLFYLKRREINRVLAVVIATNEEASVAEDLCSKFGAHAFVSQSNVSKELGSFFGDGFEFL